MRNVLLLTLFILSFSIVYSQAIKFNKIYPKPNGIDLEGVGAYELSSGNILTIARHLEGGYFAQMDPFGNKIWETFFSDSLYPITSIRAQDGKFLIGGIYTQAGQSTPTNMFLGKFDSLGNSVWINKTQIESFKSNHRPMLQIMEMADNSLRWLVPHSCSSNDTCKTSFIFSDSLGNITTQKDFDFGFHDFCEAIDSGFILIGRDYNPLNYQDEMLLMKINSTGDSVWAKRTYGIHGPYDYFNFGTSIVPGDTSYFFSALNSATTYPGSENSSVFMASLDDGDSILDYPHSGKSIEGLARTKLSSSGNFHFFYHSEACDYTPDCNAILSSVQLEVFDNFFSFQPSPKWSQEIGSFAIYFGASALSETSDGGYLLVGSTNYIQSFPQQFADVGRLRLIRFDSSGNYITSNSSGVKQRSLEVFPNPSSDFMKLKGINPTQGSPTLVQLLNSNGKVLFEKRISFENEEVDLRPYPSGVYLLKANLGGEVYTKRIIKN